MATYKKGYKKENPETVLLKVIIGIIVMVFLLVGVLYIYDISTKWRSYDNYTTLTSYGTLFDVTDDDSEEIDNYVVYIYSSNESSSDAQIDVLREAKKINGDSEMFFLLDSESEDLTDSADSDFLDTIGEDMMSYPMLIVVVDGEFYEASVGTTALLETLESIEEGTYEPFND